VDSFFDLDEEADGPLGRDSRLPLFAQGRFGDRAKPSAWQVMILNDLSGADGSCPAATDDEVLGLLGQWGAAASWMEARKLAVVREMIRRRLDPEARGLWDDRLAREVSLQLGVSIPAAQKLTWVAWSLEARLPGIGQALNEGRLDPGRVRMVVAETDVLTDQGTLARAERIILDGLATCRTWMDLQRLVQRAVCAVDPDGAAKRREQEERERARVRFWREAAGTCALSGTGLPTDEALAGYAHVDQRAQAYRKAGIKRPIDILRVAAYLDLLNVVPAADRIARFRAEDASQAARQSRQQSGQSRAKPGSGTRDDATRDDAAPAGHRPPDGHPWTSPPDGDFPPAEDPCGRCTLGHCPCRDWEPREPPCADCGRDECRCGEPAGRSKVPASPEDPAPAGRGPGNESPASPTIPDPGPSFASEVNLTLRHLDVPLLTAMGRAQRPGAARGLGALDPALARRLAEAAARSPDSAFCLTIVNADGHAIGHGCCKPKGKAPPGTGSPGSDANASRAFTIIPSGKPGPPGGYGCWLLTMPGRGSVYSVDLHPVPTGECGHQYEAARHDPGQTLRHLVHVRDGKCGFPTCSRPARESDFEHVVPHDQGGRTCGCNCWSASRSCHQLKQSDGWTVTQPTPGYRQWQTPSGRTYPQEPWRYPA
jgi:Domain of unknown function (DUF222)